MKEPRVSKYKAPNKNSLVRTPSEGGSKKPLGPRKPPPTLTPEKKKKAVGNENAVSPRNPSTTSTHGAGRVLADLSSSKANPNILGAKSRNSNVNSSFTSPDQIASFFTSPTELRVNLNIHSDSYATESVWLNRTTETAGKSQNESSFTSLGKGSVKVVSRRRDSQDNRILQTLLAAEPVTVLSPRVQSGRFHIHRKLGAVPDWLHKTRG